MISDTALPNAHSRKRMVAVSAEDHPLSFEVASRDPLVVPLAGQQFSCAQKVGQSDPSYLLPRKDTEETLPRRLSLPLFETPKEVKVFSTAQMEAAVSSLRREILAARMTLQRERGSTRSLRNECKLVLEIKLVQAIEKEEKISDKAKRLLIKSRDLKGRLGELRRRPWG